MPILGAGQVAGTAEGRTVAGRVLPRGLHYPRADRRHRLPEQSRCIRYSVPRHRSNLTHHRARSPTPRGRDRLLWRATHLGTKLTASSAHGTCASASIAPFPVAACLPITSAGLLAVPVSSFP